MISSPRDIVITGVGVVSPIGIGCEAFDFALAEGRSGVRRLEVFDSPDFRVRVGAEVLDFDPKEFVTPRKSLKVMSRSIQMAFAAAQMASRQANLSTTEISPERVGAVFGADMIQAEPHELVDAFRHCIVNGEFDFSQWDERSFSELYPLWMLKYLPNMPACHVAIAQDARGPNNTIVLGEASSLTAIAEGMRVIERGGADAMIVGGTGSRLHPLSWACRDNRLHSAQSAEPERASRPFDARRDGMVYGEGAAALILETRQQAEARGAQVLARIAGFGCAYEACTPGRPFEGTAIRASIQQALRTAQMQPKDLGHVNAHGLSTVDSDQAEALAIRDILGEVPVTALKSYFGNLGAGTGAVELVGSLLGLRSGRVPRTLNFEHADPKCPVNVVHTQPHTTDRVAALALNQTSMGQSVAIIVSAE
jgi:3-oxoacyl-[acyl-carrier-protein] synthase II